MVGRIFTSALFAGFAAGLIAALLQLSLVQPILLEAERYESGAVTLAAAEASAPHGHDHATATAGHDHGASVHSQDGDAAEPAAERKVGGFAPARDGLSVLFSMVIYTGYAFLLVAAMAVAADRGIAVTARRGILWGLAGYVAFQHAPAVGLPPEVPGSVAADLATRQIWWVGTALSAALGLGLIAFGRDWTGWGAAIVLLAAPHVVGAPEAEGFGGVVPAELAGAFATRALGVGMAAWAVLGLACGYFWQREGAVRGQPKPA